MAKPSDSRGRTKWVDEDILLLKELARSGTPTGAIALKLGRTKPEKAARESIASAARAEASMKPPARSRVDRLAMDSHRKRSFWCSPVLKSW